MDYETEIEIKITPRVAQELSCDLKTRLQWLIDTTPSAGYVGKQTPAEIRRTRALYSKVLSCTERTTTITLKQSDARDLLGCLGELDRYIGGCLSVAVRNVMEGIEHQISGR